VSIAVKSLRDIEVLGGHPAVDFVNTVHSWHEDPPPDYLHGFDDFVDWNVLSDVLEPQSAAHFKKARAAEKAKAFREALELRGNLRRLFVAITQGEALSQPALDRLNDLLRRTVPWRRLAADEGRGGAHVSCAWDLETAPAIAALGPLAWLAADLLENGRLAYLKECPADSCGWFFIDASKNHSRTWCSMKTCGNAAKVKRFRKRARGR
jgi:predicted RNA-binding Zn ribbon-like protein